MTDLRRTFGNVGELQAAEYLQSKGYKILHQQWKCPYGEIDLIAKDGQEIVFVEVKTRRAETSGYPEESVTEQKIRHLVSCAYNYLDRHGEDVPWRIDVIAIEFDQSSPKILHLQAIDIPERFG